VSEFLNNIREYPKGHPLQVYIQENILIRELISKLQNSYGHLGEFSKIFEELATVEKHLERKENQLLPYLEQYGKIKESQAVWKAQHDIRNEITVLRAFIGTNYIPNIRRHSLNLFYELEQMIEVEEKSLFPMADQLLSQDEWITMREGEKEIGWMIETPPDYPEYTHPSRDNTKRKLPFGVEDKVYYDEGYLTPAQVNFIFKILPVDITYVNEHDQVVFYNRGEDRVFPRSAGIIGREVKFCHPPKSVDQVLMILEAFKNGTQNKAEFWIEFKGRFIHISYFAVRDEEEKYRGVIEMSQDVTEIRELEGEKRLLDW
jgi:DUF438 domain-containing protein